MRKSILRTVRWGARWVPLPMQKALFRFPPFRRLARGALRLAAPDGLMEMAVTGGALKGRTLRLDALNEIHYWRGRHDAALQQAFADWVTPGMVVYDVGANIGYHSLYLAQLVGPGGEVHAFEPLPGNVARLRDNLRLNGDLRNITVVPKAAAGHDGEIDFLVHDSILAGKVDVTAGWEHAEFRSRIVVPAVSFDHYVYTEGYRPPHVMKFDIQGSEVVALARMERLLREARPLIFIDLHGREAVETCTRLLRQAGYTFYMVQAGYDAIENVDPAQRGVQLLARPPK
jgi:FkbM family methyltransferase